MADTPTPEAPTEQAPEEEKKVVRKKRSKRSVPHGRACIQAGPNNTIVTITDEKGDVLCSSSAGSCGFKGTRKSTPYAAKVTAENVAEKAQVYGVERVSVFVKGIGPGREQALRGLQGAGLDFDKIIDTTPIPHGGCRPKRRRRV